MPHTKVALMPALWSMVLFLWCLRDVIRWLQAGQTPLLLAVRKNNVAMVRELAQARVDVNHMEQVSIVVCRSLCYRTCW